MRGTSLVRCAAALAVFAMAPRARAQPQPPASDPSGIPRRVYTTERAASPPALDGLVDDPCWSAVPWTSDFVQWEPTEGEPPTYQTSFKILYDDDALYIAYRAYDADPQNISDLLARRDHFPGDWVEINIDSYFDHRTAFSFTSSVSGVRGDEFVSDDGNHWDGNWDPIWELRTRVDPEGWTAEVRIPFSQLRFPNQEEQVWGIQVQRRLFRKEERSLWQPKSKKDRGWVSRFGELRGLRGVRPQRQVELLPYTLARGERFESEPGNPFRDGRAGDFELGLDGKLGVSSNLTVDFTVNPDFGQVEADPSEVNLTAFETRFEERRPFFIEGKSILDFQLAPAIAGGGFTQDNLFYSRRIGRSPRGFPDLAANEYVDVPAATSILAAGKLTGKTGQGTSVGLLESITGRETARIAAPGGEREEAVEPLANFLVGRAQQDLRGGDTRLGTLATAVHRDLSGPSVAFLHRAAYTGGADMLHQWKNKTFYTALNLAASRVEGQPEALLRTQTASARYFQRPDNDYESVDSLRTSLSGYAGSARFGKQSGKHWRFETGAAWRSPGFEINDAGFMQRADEVNQFTWVGYSIQNPFSVFRRAGFNFNQWLDWDFGGTSLAQRANFNFNMTLNSNWQYGAGATRTWERISNTALRGGPSSLWPGDTSSWFWVNSDYRRRVNGGFGVDFDDGDGDWTRFRNYWLDLSYRPSNAFTVTLSPSYSTNDVELQFVDIPTSDSDGAPRYVFGQLDQETAALTVRLDYTIRPNLTLQFYGAPFVSAGAYTTFKHVDAPRAAEFSDRFHTYGAGEIRFDAGTGRYEVDEGADGSVDYGFDQPDFNVREFNSNLVLRWEYDPGSTLFVVWSQSRSDFAPDGHFALQSNADSLFDVHPYNVFLLKLSKWFSL
jgi:hypothetical protein